MADPFHQAAIPSDDIGMMVNELWPVFCCHMAFSHCHANGIGDALSKGAGGGFNSGSMTKFRMSGCWAA